MFKTEAQAETYPIKTGDTVRVTQILRGREDVWETTVEGVVESVRKEPTGSWYAHGKHDRLWLLRVRLRKHDGEITNLVIEPSSRIEKR